MRCSVRRQAARAGKSALALLTLVAAVTAGTTAAASAASPKAGSAQTALRADLAQYLRARGAADHISAVSLRVTYPDARPALAASVGTTTYGGSTPVSDRALWQIGSNTKSMTSVVMLQLEAERELSVNDTLGKWLPQYRAWRGITIRQLLSMTSGIADYSETPAFAAAIQADPARTFTAASLIEMATGRPLGPTSFTYSNTNYLLAQLIIERAAHDSYADQVTRRIFVPLGLRESCVGGATCPARVASRVPTGYSMEAALPALQGKPVPPLALSWAQGSGGVVSSLKDLTTWDRALYSGRVLPAAQQRELTSLISMTTSKPITSVTSGDPLGFGLGVAQRTDPVTGVVWAYEGEVLGYRVLHMYFPHSGLLMAVAVNSGGVDVDTLRDFAESVHRTLPASHRR